MELCERGSLAGLLSARGGRLPPDEVVPAIVDIAGGLASLHARGFVHRDVKPHNILLTAGGAKLGDFGIARTGDSTSAFTAPGTAVGTLAYLAPELLAGGEATPAADVFALGVVVYQALTGRLPRPAGTVLEFVNAQGSPIPPPSEVRPELGTFFDAPVAAALASDPADAAGADGVRERAHGRDGRLAARGRAPRVRRDRDDGHDPVGPRRTAPDPAGPGRIRRAQRPRRPGTRTATIRVRTTRRPPAPTWVSPAVELDRAGSSPA